MNHEDVTRRSEALLPIGPVKNRVVEVSDDFVDLDGAKIGESTSFALMLKTGAVPSETLVGGVERGHRRLVNIENTFVTDKKGLRWEDVHVKGAGFMPQRAGMILRAQHWFKKITQFGPVYYGLNTMASAMREWKNG